MNRIQFMLIFAMTMITHWASAQSSVWLRGDDIREAMLNGVTLDEGDYSVWVWSQDGLPVTVTVAGQNAAKEAVLDTKEPDCSWKRVLQFKAGSKGEYTFSLTDSDTHRWLSGKGVGYVVFTQNPDWNPESFFAMTRLFPKTAEAVKDDRALKPKSLNDYYTFIPFESRRQWLDRRQEMEDHIRASMGALPEMERTPLNTHIFDKTEYDDYSVEKVYFESVPGFFVTGNLYRPKGKPGPYPAVLGPHGHWGMGRLAHEENGSVPSRAISFAEQGYIAFNYDMIGYVDSKQLKHTLGGPMEQLWGISLHGMQYWNSIRAIDFLLSLPDVDANKIACSGASGGGTQTIFLMATDPRVQVAAPVNMISAHMQGGCECENAPNLRIHDFNVEFAAMMAPRPLLMVSATGDWTDETPWNEYPAVRSVYNLFDAAERLHSVQIDAPHNYNQKSREEVYNFFNQWLAGNHHAERLTEPELKMEDESKLRVFPGDLPESALSENQLIHNLIDASKEKLESMKPDSAQKLKASQRVLYTALKHTLGIQLPQENEFQVTRIEKVEKSDYYVEKMVLGRKGVGDQIPALLITPHINNLNSPCSLLVDENGKEHFFDAATGEPSELVKSLLQEGHRVLMPDVFLTGEHHSPFAKTERVREVRGGHFYTYNQSDTALRVQDIVTCAAFLQMRSSNPSINLVGTGQGGLWTLLAAPFISKLSRVAVDSDGFDNKNDESLLEKFFVPDLRRVGDFKSAQALLAPVPLLIENTQDRFDTEWAKLAYQSLDASGQIHIVGNAVGEKEKTEFVTASGK